ncbi:MAG: DUF420 domain-containing protein [Bryobacteraceae bacterium]
MNVHDLPLLNATLNGTAAVLLTCGYLLIRRRRVAAHRAVMIAAFCVSVAFLISYIVYHAHIGSKHYEGTGLLRPIYYSILLTHTLLAITVPVLAIMTLRRGLRRDDVRHRAIARWTLPIWLYVSVTGVVVYAMLYHP